MSVVDLNHSVVCTLNDANLAVYPEGVSIDSTTHIAVIGNDDSTATALNLLGSSFTGESKPPCELIEGGTPPNSVRLEALPVARSPGPRSTPLRIRLS